MLRLGMYFVIYNSQPPPRLRSSTSSSGHIRAVRVGMFYSFCVALIRVAPKGISVPRALLPFFVSQYLLPSAVNNTAHPQYHCILRRVLAPLSHHCRSHTLPSQCSNPAACRPSLLVLTMSKGFADSQLFDWGFWELVWGGYK